MIPKIIHRIWVGTADPPTKYWHLWRSLHPEWQIINHWHPPRDDIPIMAQVDIFKAAVLAEHGGFYVDNDVEPVGLLEPLRIHNLCMPTTHGRTVSNCFVGCAPSHPAMLALHDVLSTKTDITDISNDVGSAFWSRFLARDMTRIKPYLVDALAGHKEHSHATIAKHWGTQTWRYHKTQT